MRIPMKSRVAACRLAMLGFVIASTLFPVDARAQDAAEMAKKLQDPLANIKALMTDNDVNFNSGNDQTSYGFQLQPVYAASFEKAGFNLINRAVVPIMGLAAQATKPPLVDRPSSSGDLTWGLSDMLLQFFFNPRSESAWKWGLGPMFSLRTRTQSELAGPGWGAGAVGVLVGGVGSLSIAAIGGHLWGQDRFSTSILQPMLFYNFGATGWSLHYNNIISHDWSASSSNAWTVPLGLGVGKVFALGAHGLEPAIGLYYNVARPAGAADWTLKWAINWLLP